MGCGKMPVVIDAANRNTALASAFAQELARCGLRHAVVSPGSRSTPLAVALYRQPEIEVSVVVDERSAGFIALGAAQASGRPVALLCTSGTAAANYHPAVAEADLSAVPLVVLTADRPPELRDIGAGQTIDQIKLYGSAVRWFAEVGSHEADDEGLLHLRATACRAYAVAAGDPRPGPVHLNFPWREPLAPHEVEGQVTATNPLALTGRGDRPLTEAPRTTVITDPAAIDQTAQRIAATPNGLILVGRQTDPALRDPITALAERTGYPVLAEPTSQLRLGPHDLSGLIWAYDEILADPSQVPVPELILRFGEFPTSKRLRLWVASLADTRQVAAPGLYGWNEPSRIADQLLRGNATTVARTLLARLQSQVSGGDALGGPADRPGAGREVWRKAQREAIDRQLTAISNSESLTPAAIHHALAACYRDGDLVYTNSSMAIRDQETYLTLASTDVHFLANRGANGIDGLLASGIGAALASGRPTTIITGDVALLHDLGSLASWRLPDAPVRILVINDEGGTIFNRLPQSRSMPPIEFATLMTTPPGIEPAKAAELFGMPYHRLGTVAELPALLAGGSCLIEAPIAS